MIAILKANQAHPLIRPTSTDLVLHKLDEVTDALQAFLPRVTELEDAAGRAQITTTKEYEKGSTFLSLVGAEYSQIDSLRKTVKKPIDDYAKLIQATFTGVLGRLELARSKVETRMRAFYVAEQERIRIEQENERKRQQQEAEELALAAEASGATETATAILEAATAPVVVPRPSLGSTNAVGGRTVVSQPWKATVESPMEILKAVIAGTVPISVIDFKQNELNNYARSLKVAGVFHGIRVFQDVQIGQRS